MVTTYKKPTKLQKETDDFSKKSGFVFRIQYRD